MDVAYSASIACIDKASNRKVFDCMHKFIEDFSLFIKQYYHIVWSVEKIQKVKIQKLQGQKMEE